MSYIDASGSLNVGTVTATEVVLGAAATPITFAASSTCDFTNAAITNFIAPPIGAVNQIVYHNGSSITSTSTFTYKSSTQNLFVANLSATGTHLCPTGSVSAPPFTFTSTATTGMYFNAKTGPTIAVNGVDCLLPYYTSPTLVSGVQTMILSTSIPALGRVGLIIEYFTQVFNATLIKTYTGIVSLAAINSSAGTVTAVLSVTPPTNTYAIQVLSSGVAGSFTLVFTTTVITGTPGSVRLNVTPTVTGITTPLGFNMYLMVRNLSPASVLTFT
jgi:hypothetical protein